MSNPTRGSRVTFCSRSLDTQGGTVKTGDEGTVGKEIQKRA